MLLIRAPMIPEIPLGVKSLRYDGKSNHDTAAMLKAYSETGLCRLFVSSRSRGMRESPQCESSAVPEH
jgi:hypothetical protein